MFYMESTLRRFMADAPSVDAGQLVIVKVATTPLTGVLEVRHPELDVVLTVLGYSFQDGYARLGVGTENLRARNHSTSITNFAWQIGSAGGDFKAKNALQQWRKHLLGVCGQAS